MKSFYLFVFIGLFFTSCVKNNPDPSWIEVNKWTLEANVKASVQQGALTHNFTDACVFVDGKIMGIFEVPFKIPILSSGSVQIKIYPVVKNNGISVTKKIYPFMESFDLTATLESNKTLKIDPITRYGANTQFWIEDFEDASLKIETNPVSKAIIERGNDPLILKSGNYYGQILLNEEKSNWIANTTSPTHLILPKGGKEVYLEIDYHNTNSVTTGLLAYSSTGVKNNINIMLNKQNATTVVWKKIYIYLTELVSYSTSANYFEIYLEALHEAGLPSTNVYIDNIKVVY